MREILKKCALDGNTNSRIVFEPVNLTPSEVARLFDDVRDKKFLELLNGQSRKISDLRGKLIVSDYGVIAIGFHVEEDASGVFVLLKVIGVDGNFLLAYEFSNSSFSIFLEKDGKIDVIKISNRRLCANLGFKPVCWTFPVYVLFPSLYPDLCDGELCKRVLAT